MKDEKKSLWWSLYGIMVEEHWDTYDRRRSIYDIFVPKLDKDNQIISFRHEDCGQYRVRTFKDVERIINRIPRIYMKQLAAAMEESERKWRESKHDTQEG